MVLISIRDRRDRSFFPPQVYSTQFEALRTLAATARKAGNMLNEFPGDFEVFKLADFQGKLEVDGENPVILCAPQFLATVDDLLAQYSPREARNG